MVLEFLWNLLSAYEVQAGVLYMCMDVVLVEKVFVDLQNIFMCWLGAVNATVVPFREPKKRDPVQEIVGVPTSI
jgi:hypothetical protein